ncbi:MAG: alpha/beta hydrolase [Massilibacteroides sp.]|nr:alpha/beta hydrolase [Massilibacteroides sp.]MDD3061679.1 alpha/beta hydrolase [Massilibacteroides sp.]MDD4114403.1 alpha/beta hydrolase [Massilibacteroides sp.]MDD4660276.1 alpha/beta hydrolase [Massilibacteroides sp.]
MKKLVILFFIAFTINISPFLAQSPRFTGNISYKENSKDEYSRERCKLDIYLPASEKGFQTLVWFHGGGLTGGDKTDIPAGLKEKGICIVSVNYRLSPRVQHPAYIEDAAAAVAWVIRHIGEYGGDSSQVFVGGHSAGGYLTLMIGLDKHYLQEQGVDADQIKTYYPISGQAITHFQIRTERALSTDIPLIDEYAPLAHVRKEAAPFLIIAGQAEREMACRTVENRFLYEALQAVGNKTVVFHELSGFNHGTVVEPASLLILQDMKSRK